MNIWHKLIHCSFYSWAGVVPLIFLPFTSELFEFPKFTVTALLAVLILLFWGLRCVGEKKLIFRRTPLDIPIIIFLVSQLLSLLFSVDHQMSWWGYYSRWNGGVLAWLMYSCLYWAAVSNLDRKHTLYIVNWSLVIAGIVSFWAILESTGQSFSCLVITGNFDVECWKQKVQERVFASLGQPNWLASYLLALLFVPLPQSLSLIKERDVRVRWLKTAGFIFMLLAIYLTHSRSGFLALVVGSIVYVSFSYSKKLLWLLVPITIISSIYIYSLSTKHLALSTNSNGTESLSIRINNVWPGAISAWLSSPKTFWVGWGPETFSTAYARFRPISHNLTSEWQMTYNKAHNEFLNFLTTTGIIGLLAYLYLFWSIIRVFLNNSPLRPPLDSRGGSEGALPAAIFAGWTTLLVTNFWGFSVTVTNTLLLLLPALAISLTNPSGQIAKPLNKWLVLPFALLCLWALVSLGKYYFADVALARSRKLMAEFERTQKPELLIDVYDNVNLAYRLNYREPTITSELAYSAAFLAAALQKNDPDLAHKFLDAALAASDQSLAQSPQNPSWYRSRARTLLLLANIDKNYLLAAAETLRAAKALAPTDPRIPAQLAQITSDLGDNLSAAKYKEETLKLKADYFTN